MARVLRGALVMWVVLSGGAACREPFPAPAGTQVLAPPAEYLGAWQSVEACSGILGQLERIRWYIVPGATIPYGQGVVYGVWHPPHSIYLSAFAAHDAASDYFTVRHEMLHDLLQGGADHPPVFQQCGLMRD